MSANLSAAILARLLTLAKQRGDDYSLLPNRFALERPMSLSSVYTLLHRHHWRKLAPDNCHPRNDPVAQEE